METLSYRRLAPRLLKAFALVGVFGVFGCARYVKTPAPVDQGSYLVHVVTSNGETVRGLTRWYTGSERSVREVATINSLREGIYLKPGQRVLIPSGYIRKTTPPPKQQFARKAQPRPRKGGGEVEELPLASDPSTNIESSELGAATPAPNHEAPNVAPVNGGEAVSAPLEPATSPTAQPSVVPKELSLEELLKREQSEVDRLKEELEVGQPAPSGGSF